LALLAIGEGGSAALRGGRDFVRRMNVKELAARCCGTA